MTRHHRVVLVALVSAVTLSSGAHAQRGDVRHEFRELHMGLEVRMVIYADAKVARAAARAGFDRIAALEQMMSDYRPSSELARLHENAGRFVSVSPELFHVLRTGVTTARRTSGAFDPTVGPLVLLWRQARRQGRLPAAATLAEARSRVSWRDLDLDSAGSRVRLRGGMRLDVGGVAKGYIIEQALHLLRSRGAGRALIEAGGDIVVGDSPPGRNGWQVDVPHGDAEVARRAASVENAAIATSGPGAQFVEIEGARYSHVVDPRTGWALTSGVHATVIARDAAVADALATALTVLPAEDRQQVMMHYGDVVLAWSVR